MPYLVMSVLDTRVKCDAKTKQKTKLEGYAVGLQKKQEGNPAQQWKFTKEGAICSAVCKSCLMVKLKSSKIVIDGSSMCNTK